MAKRRHKNDTKTFAEETCSEQAKTINAGIVYLGKAIKANIKRTDLDKRETNKAKRAYFGTLEHQKRKHLNTKTKHLNTVPEN